MSFAPNNLTAAARDKSDSSAARFRSVRALARALGVSKPTAVKCARRGRWPQRTIGNRLEFAPPPGVEIGQLESAPPLPSPTVCFGDLATTAARDRALLRFQAVCTFLAARGPVSDQVCLETVSAVFNGVFSPRQLRRWVRGYQAYGLNGLCDQRLNRCGVKRRNAEASA